MRLKEEQRIVFFPSPGCFFFLDDSTCYLIVCDLSRRFKGRGRICVVLSIALLDLDFRRSARAIHTSLSPASPAY